MLYSGFVFYFVFLVFCIISLREEECSNVTSCLLIVYVISRSVLPQYISSHVRSIIGLHFTVYDYWATVHPRRCKTRQ